MAWRLARGLEKLRAQVNEKWPNRRKDSDGSVGDTSHAARPSDHNPVNGVVHAIDITHDPRGGFDSYAFADLLLKNQDHRVKYIISNRRIGSGPSGTAPGSWRKYTGSNAHDHHVHISIVSGALQDDVSPWDIGQEGIVITAGVDSSFVPPKPTVRKGSQGEYVKVLQAALGFLGPEIDGDFGGNTETKLKAFQAAHHIVADGICGPQTWALITAAKPPAIPNPPEIVLPPPGVPARKNLAPTFMGRVADLFKPKA